jgi:Holliday junction resolvasome RuvABC endonuclease subunit
VIVLGLDAATSTGWAIVGVAQGKTRLYDFGIANVHNWRSLGKVVAAGVSAGAETAALEVPYVDKSPDTAIKLGMIAGRWMQELDRAGLRYTQHKAQQWQSNLLKGLIVPRSPREERKRAAGLWVKCQFGLVVKEDEADAICLATWGAKVGNVAQLALGG